MDEPTDEAPTSWIPLAFACPHCGRPGISLLRKLSLGPSLPTRCRECGQRVGVPWSSLLFPGLPWLALSGLLALLMTSAAARKLPQLPGLLVPTHLAVSLTVLGAAWVLFTLWWIHRVPLVRC